MRLNRLELERERETGVLTAYGAKFIGLRLFRRLVV